jgi:DNA-binding protein Fis
MFCYRPDPKMLEEVLCLKKRENAKIKDLTLVVRDNQTEAARLLGINSLTLRKKLGL